MLQCQNIILSIIFSSNKSFLNINTLPNNYTEQIVNVTVINGNVIESTCLVS